jgi:hypothetical protein
MGDVAELILDGIICEFCGCLIDGEITGYPRKCEECTER